MEDLEKKIKEEKEMYVRFRDDIQEEIKGHRLSEYKFGDQDINISDTVNEIFEKTMSFAVTEHIKLQQKIKKSNVSFEDVRGEDAVVKYFADLHQSFGNNFYTEALKQDSDSAKEQIIKEIGAIFPRYTKDPAQKFEALMQYGDVDALETIKKAVINQSVEQIETGVQMKLSKLNGTDKIAFASVVAGYKNSDLGIKADPINYVGNLSGAVMGAIEMKVNNYLSSPVQERSMDNYNGRTLQP